MSALPEITAWIVSPAPWVPKFSSTSLRFLKMPASWPSVGAWFSQLLIWPITSLSVSWRRRRRQRRQRQRASAAAVRQPRALHHLLPFLAAFFFAPAAAACGAATRLPCAPRRCASAVARGGASPFFSTRRTQYSQARLSGPGC